MVYRRIQVLNGGKDYYSEILVYPACMQIRPLCFTFYINAELIQSLELQLYFCSLQVMIFDFYYMLTKMSGAKNTYLLRR